MCKTKNILALVSLVTFLGGSSLAYGLSFEATESIEERKQELQKIKKAPELIEKRSNAPLEDKIFVRGESLTFDVAPQMEDGRTLIPVRKVSKALGAHVDWVSKENMVVIERDNTTIEMVLGKKEVLVDGKKNELEVPGQAIDGRTLVPLRFVSEILGDSVEYHSETGEIDIGLETPKRTKPTEVVEKYWSSYKNQEDLEDMTYLDREDELDLEIDLEELTEEDKQVLERFQLKPIDYKIEDDISYVNVEFTKPNFEVVLENYYKNAKEVLITEDKSEKELQNKLDSIMTETIINSENISYTEQLKLRLQENEWKIYDFSFENMEKRWSESEEL
ncbi:copper amine oxidase N-terminal domain-containing protein [Natranaerobius trueperi]|uniref:Copper amine oxidase-like N-terminal domain-containing protein n=1 Tax=Natranaerobius trueperi TaxID=759412 RepID=A0A226BYI2_9FIRM|nr:copper amine oxidase N-terminal domain-containing protein [Natranaerobius trueperi]OWZ83394.1 hypothetical protein CDO51_08820 [Natranaerobius trueperi]